MAAADQALSIITKTPTFSLAALLLYGSASRLPRGSTSIRQFYRYQTERLPNDGSTAAKIAPIIDATLALSLLYPGLSRKIASGFVLLFLIMGVSGSIKKGLDTTPDVLLAGWALLNLIMVLLFPVFGPDAA